MKKDEIVTLMRFTSSGEANIYKSLLEANGIPCMLVGEMVNDIYPVGNSWSEIELQIAAADEARAHEILASGFDEKEFKKDTE